MLSSPISLLFQPLYSLIRHLSIAKNCDRLAIVPNRAYNVVKKWQEKQAEAGWR
jgi:hypothetical protein